MEASFIMLIIIMACSFLMTVLAVKAEGCAKDTLHVFCILSNAFIFIASLLGLILTCGTAKLYKSEYDKIIKNIDNSKTKVIKERDEITDIYITVKGKEYHFDFKEEK